MIPASRRLSWLTERERAVLAALMLGQSAEQIAAEHYVSVCTVRSQIRAIMQKLGVRTQLAAVALAYRELVAEDEYHAAFERVVSA